MIQHRPSPWLFLLFASMLRCGSSASPTQGSPAGSDASGVGASDSGVGTGKDTGVIGPDAIASGGDAGSSRDATKSVDDGGATDVITPPMSGDACSKSPQAFPGAVGFGAAATGGRGYAAVHVTNLNDSGAGSFREAVSGPNHVIVFDVGGIINLASAVSVSGNLTIAGQTAPGGGIALEGAEISFSNSSNDIVRDVRFRQGTNDPDTGKSGIAADSSMLLILDHVSIEFGQWDNMDINSGMNVTTQRSIIADPIGQQFNAHCTSLNLTWFEDIFSSAHNRSPLAKGDTQFINNVVYDFQAGYTSGDTSGTFSYDVVNNYFITGPATTNAGDAFFQVNNQLFYFEGNMLDSTNSGALTGTTMGLPGGAKALTAPFDPTTTGLATATAAEAYATVVATSGALPRDDVDTLVVADVTSLGKTGHLWTSQSQTGLTNGGYGVLAGGTPPVDTDGDGISDAWEEAHGLSTTDPSDAIAEYGCTGYTNIEEYINELADSLM